MSCWRYTPTPKQDRFQDLLEAIRPELLFQQTSTVERRSCVVYAKTTILCQFGLFFATSLLTHISINSQPFLVGIVSVYPYTKTSSSTFTG